MGWRRIAFAGFCVALVVAGSLFLSGDVGTAQPRTKAQALDRELVGEIRKALVPAMVLLGLLALATPWLVGRDALHPLFGGRSPKRDSRRTKTWFWIGVVLFTTTAGTIWSGRMGASLWFDESTSTRLYLVGRWKHDDKGNGKMLRPSWITTLYGYETPNNHQLYTIAARALHDRLVGVNDSDFSKPYFSEVVLRIPAIVAALVSVGLVGYLALRLCSLLAAWLAMGWVALHPWYLEFATSARGYAFAMCALALAAVAAVQIITRGGGWRWWVAYGIGLVTAFASVPTVAHTLVLLNVAVFAGVLSARHASGAVRRAHFGAFLATNLVACAFAIMSFLPRKEQFDAFIDFSQGRLAVGWGGLADCVSSFLVGLPYYADDEGLSAWPSTDRWPVWIFITVALVLGAALVVAAWRSWRAGTFTGLLVAACLLPPFSVFFQSRILIHNLHPWYAVWQTPLVIAVFAGGVAWIIEHGTRRLPGAAVPAAGALALYALASASGEMRKFYLTVPVEPARESAALMRDSPNPFAPGQEKVLTCSLHAPNHLYDPWNRRLRSVDEFWVLIAESERTGKPLYCDTVRLGDLDVDFPGCAELLINSGGFELVKALPGQTPDHFRHVYRYKRGSLRAAIPKAADSTNPAVTDSPTNN